MNRLRRVGTVTVLSVCVVALAAGVGAWRASRAASLGPTMEGPCRLRAVLEPSGTVLDPSISGGVYELPAVGLIRYDAELPTFGDPRRRRLVGRVWLDLPPLLPDVTLGRWDDFGSLPDNQGVQRYSLPERLAPTGATVRITAQHQEQGGTSCRASLSVRLSGSAFGSALRPIAVLFLVATAWLTARALLPRERRTDPWSGRPALDPRWTPGGRPGLGVLAGFTFGLCSALVLVLSSAVALHSWWVTLCPLIAMTGGLLLGWLGPCPPAHPDRANTAAGDGEPPALALLDPSVGPLDPW